MHNFVRQKSYHRAFRPTKAVLECDAVQNEVEPSNSGTLARSLFLSPSLSGLSHENQWPVRALNESEPLLTINSDCRRCRCRSGMLPLQKERMDGRPDHGQPAGRRARAAVFQHFPCIMLSTSSQQIVRQVPDDYAAHASHGFLALWSAY